VNGLYGLKNKNGDVILDAEYSYIDNVISPNGIIMVKDKDGNKVKVELYDDVEENVELDESYDNLSPDDIKKKLDLITKEIESLPLKSGSLDYTNPKLKRLSNKRAKLSELLRQKKKTSEGQYESKKSPKSKHLTEAVSDKDKKVILAFIDKKPLEGKGLSTDGKKLEKISMGKVIIAKWMGNKIVPLGEFTVKSEESYVNKLKKETPKNSYADDKYLTQDAKVKKWEKVKK
jgi:hypothetical protein